MPQFQVVPQLKYYCESTQKGFRPLPPLYFTVEGNEGIKISNTMNMTFAHLYGPNDPMFVEGDTGPSVSLRIHVHTSIKSAHVGAQSFPYISFWNYH
jgi:hypothetical protein